MSDQTTKRGEAMDIQKRLEYLRGEIRAERISWGELIELQDLAEHIDPGDVELLEAAGVPESHPFPAPPEDPDEDRVYQAHVDREVNGETR